MFISIKSEIKKNKKTIAISIANSKKTLRTKLKAPNQEKRLQKWKDHFKSLLGNESETTEKSIKMF